MVLAHLMKLYHFNGFGLLLNKMALGDFFSLNKIFFMRNLLSLLGGDSKQPFGGWSVRFSGCSRWWSHWSLYCPVCVYDTRHVVALHLLIVECLWLCMPLAMRKVHVYECMEKNLKLGIQPLGMSIFLTRIYIILSNFKMQILQYYKAPFHSPNVGN